MIASCILTKKDVHIVYSSTKKTVKFNCTSLNSGEVFIIKKYHYYITIILILVISVMHLWPFTSSSTT